VGKLARLSIRTTKVQAYTLHPIKKEDIKREQKAPFSTLTKRIEEYRQLN
jgi:hypothetical protein